MQMRKAKYLLTAVILFAVFAGCKKATDYHPILYFTGTEQSPETKFTVDGPSVIGISITCSNKVSKDIGISFKIKPELLDAYNDLKRTTYKLLPAGSYILNASSVVIKAGVNVSNPATFSITSLANFREGVTYCVPIS